MKIDRYTKVVLTIIAGCLLWMSFVKKAPNAKALQDTGNPRFTISAAGNEQVGLRAYRTNVYTGQMDICSFDEGCLPIKNSKVFLTR